MPARHKVYLPIHQLAEIIPDDLGYRLRCRMCGGTWRWIDEQSGLDGFADHLKDRHRAHGGKRKPVTVAKSTTTE